MSWCTVWRDTPQDCIDHMRRAHTVSGTMVPSLDGFPGAMEHRLTFIRLQGSHGYSAV